MFKQPLFLPALALVLGSLFCTNSFAQTVDCGPLVSLDDGILVVEPDPVDDTVAIQCALDTAKAQGIPTVKLTDGLFAISQVVIEDFNGTLEGRSKTATVLFVFDESLDCGAEVAAGRTPAAFKFIRGNVKVGKMRLEINRPCTSDNSAGNQFVFIHFTGSDANSGCDSETGFGQVDRADLLSFNGLIDGEGLPTTAVGAFAEGVNLGTCRDTLLGTNKFNRGSTINFANGLFLSLRGSGQVDVNFSIFEQNQTAVFASEANQLLTVQSNDFIADDGFFGDQTFVNVINSNSGPNDNRVVVYNNDFLWGDIQEFGNGVSISADTAVRTSAAVTQNRFEINDPEGTIGPVVFAGVNNGNISGNWISGTPFSGIEILRGQTNVIAGNDLSDAFPFIGDTVFLNSDSEGNIVGPGQGAIVLDEGTGNIVLSPQAALVPSAKINADKNSDKSANSSRQNRFANMRERAARGFASKAAVREQ